MLMCVIIKILVSMRVMLVRITALSFTAITLKLLYQFDSDLEQT